MRSVASCQADLAESVGALGDEVRLLASKTILLTGGAGFLGRSFRAFFAYVNENVLDSPCRVVSLDNHVLGPDPAGDGSGNGCTQIVHDVVRPIRLDESVDFVIHAAGIASPHYYRKYPIETLEVATLGTRNVLELAVERRPIGVLYFSSSEIYGDPEAGHVPTRESYRGNVACIGPRACYDESKRLGETLCHVYHRLHGVPVKIVRPFNIYGPGMRQDDYRVMPNLALRCLGGEPLCVYGSGSQTRTFCYLSDGLAGFLKALLVGRSGEAYNIGNDQPEISMLDLARLVAEVSGMDAAVNLVDYPAAYPADEPMRRCPDLAKARAELGYAPRVDLRDGLARFLAWAGERYTFHRPTTEPSWTDGSD